MKPTRGATNCLYPLPTVLVGANVGGKPNYITIAHVGVMDPGSVSLGMNKAHFTNAGIKETGTFSINIPSVDMVKETDYCGLVSGRTTDKSKIFETFYGVLKTAPMISECPVNMECKLVHTVDFPRHDIFIGEIVATYSEDEYITDGIIDISKVRPILFVMSDRSYWKLGNRLARAWHIGKQYKAS